jgi:hypothetical protein
MPKSNMNETLAAKVQGELHETEFACSNLQVLSGGTANFLWRGTLDRPVSDTTEAFVVVKHGEDHVATNPGFKLTTVRCVSVHPNYVTIEQGFPAYLSMVSPVARIWNQY